MATNKIQAALECLKNIHSYIKVVNELSAPDLYKSFECQIETIREVLQDALNPWNYNMDEAPKDGTKIRVLEKDGDVYAVHWSKLVDAWVIFGDIYCYNPIAFGNLPNQPEKTND